MEVNKEELSVLILQSCSMEVNKEELSILILQGANNTQMACIEWDKQLCICSLGSVLILWIRPVEKSNDDIPTVAAFSLEELGLI